MRWTVHTRSVVTSFSPKAVAGPGRRTSCAIERLRGAWHRSIRPVGQGDRPAQSGSVEADGEQLALGRHGDGGYDGGTEAGGDEGEDAVHLATLAHEARFDARVATGVQGDLAQVVALAEHDERQAVELGHRHAAAGRGGQGMIGCHGQDERVVEERRGGDERVVDGQHHQGEVDFAAGQLAHELARSRLDHQQLDPRVARMEFDQGRGQHAGDQAGRGADGEAPTGHPAECPRLGTGGLHIGQDRRMKGRSASPSAVSVTRPCPGPR